MCPDLVCDPDRGYCVECVREVDCGADQECRDGSCVDVPPPECTVDGDCPEGQSCDAGRCITPPECMVDGDCGS
jgi:Cys-rich repeat protein